MATELCCWWPLSVWISPGAALFVFINVLVGVIAVTSREQPVGAPASRRRLCRSTSTSSSMVVDRLLPFSMFPVVHHAAGCSYQPSYQEEEGEQRVMSGLAPEQPVPEPAAAAEPPSAPAAEAFAADATASMSATHTEANVQEQSQQHHATELVPRPAPAANANEATAAVERPGNKRSRTKAAAKRSKQGRARASRQQEAEEAEGKAAELKASVEFKLQRLNSIINYTSELRRRGVSVAPERN